MTNLKALCEEHFSGRYHLEVIDVEEDPQSAEDQHILATPTLVREAPPPVRRIIGDLSDTPRLLAALEVGPLNT